MDSGAGTHFPSLGISTKRRRISFPSAPPLPNLSSSDYFTEPSADDLASMESVDPGYCSRVRDFTVGRHGYGRVKFLGHTDVRWLNINGAVRFSRHEVVVCDEDDNTELNKPSVVTLILLTKVNPSELRLKKITEKLKSVNRRQGASFISFNESTLEWTFSVLHFSRFGFSEDDEADIIMEDVAVVVTTVQSEENTKPMILSQIHFKEDSDKHDEDEDLVISPSSPPKKSTPARRSAPRLLIEYKHTHNGTLLLNESSSKPLKPDGFRLDLNRITPLSAIQSSSNNVVDASLFMGRSFRAGWGPNGILAHSGNTITMAPTPEKKMMSSIVTLQRIPIDRIVRDDEDNLKEERVASMFDSPLNLHRETAHESEELDYGLFKLNLQKLVSDRSTLPEICRGYIEIAENESEMTSEVSTWELINVLFSSRSDEIHRRADFSSWLQDAVYETASDDESGGYLRRIFAYLTRRQLDAAVRVAASYGDVRLACMISQAGGSTENRAAVSEQLDVWRSTPDRFRFIETDRVRIYELLAGIETAAEIDGDWKRRLGMMMWYVLPPDAPLPGLFGTLDGDPPDIACHLMALHAGDDGGQERFRPSMFRAASDPFDYHAIWHVKEALEAAGVVRRSGLHALDMGYAAQLLSAGLCHWAVYVVLHAPRHRDFPHLQVAAIREILFRYCDVWNSAAAVQRPFMEALGIPTSWFDEALAAYHAYLGDFAEAVRCWMRCGQWERAHSAFLDFAAPPLFLDGDHAEVARVASDMEAAKSEIPEWDSGSRIYSDFYRLRSRPDDAITVSLLEGMNVACREFFLCLNRSLSTLGAKLTVQATVVYCEMAKVICDVLVSAAFEVEHRELQFDCFQTVFIAPVSGDTKSSHLQDAVSLFTSFL